MRWAIAGVAAVLLTACTNTGDGNWVGAGQPTETFVNTRVAAAYIPLHHFSLPGMRRGAATIILSGIAVTNAHNANLVDDEDDLGHAPSGEDIMFIRVHEQPIGGAGPLSQLWLFIVAPLIGGALGAVIWRYLLAPGEGDENIGQVP